MSLLSCTPCSLLIRLRIEIHMYKSLSLLLYKQAMWCVCSSLGFFGKSGWFQMLTLQNNHHCSSENEAHEIFAAGKWICSEAIPGVCFDRCQLMDIGTKVYELPYFTPCVSWHITFLYLLCFH